MAWVIEAHLDQSPMDRPMTPSPQKVALVTGAARGIGLAVARRFLAEGWCVALLDIEGELLWKSVEALAAAGHTLGLHFDVSMAKAVPTTEIRADYPEANPLNRYGLEEELAEAVFFLCSGRSSYITGQILAVDGGFDAAGIGLPTLRGERQNG